MYIILENTLCMYLTCIFKLQLSMNIPVCMTKVLNKHFVHCIRKTFSIMTADTFIYVYRTIQQRSMISMYTYFHAPYIDMLTNCITGYKMTHKVSFSMVLDSAK